MSDHIAHLASAPWALAIAGLLWLLVETVMTTRSASAADADTEVDNT